MLMKTLKQVLILFHIIHALDTSCQQVNFWELKGYNSSGYTVLQGTPGASRKQCTRACRLYADCYAFSMLWEDTRPERGTCQLLTWTRGRRPGLLLQASGASFFGFCPKNMVQNLDNGHCYLLIQEKRNRTGARDHCRDNIHPLANLVDITSAGEDRLVIDMVQSSGGKWYEMCTVPNGSDIVYTAGQRMRKETEFTWRTTGDVIANYTNWLPDFPKKDESKRCIYVGAHLTNLSAVAWKNQGCGAIRRSMCEF